jgi:hypothetical protein
MILIFPSKISATPVSSGLDTRVAYAEPANALSALPIWRRTERAQMEFDAQKVDSFTLTIQIDAPDGQHATVDLDLASIRRAVK